MTRRFILIFGLILICLVASLFQLKHKVVKLEERLVNNQQQIEREQESIKILKAEWSFLTSPGRVQVLSEAFLNLEITNINQIGVIEKIPFFMSDNLNKDKSVVNE